MIDDKKLDEAAYIFATSQTHGELLALIDGYKEGYKDAINEFLKNLWHPAREEPENDRYVLLELKYSCIKPVIFYNVIEYNDCYDEPWNSKSTTLNIIRWLYIDDLLPKKEDVHD